MRWLHIVSALFRDGGPSGIVINTGPFEHSGFAIFAIEAAGALVRGVLLRRLIIQAALRARKHDRGLCYGGHPAITLLIAAFRHRIYLRGLLTIVLAGLLTLCRKTATKARLFWSEVEDKAGGPL